MLTLMRSLKIYLYLIIIMLLFRVSFSLYFLEVSFIQDNISEVLYAFFMGFRYDSIVACYILLPYILVHHLIVLVPTQFVKKLVSSISAIYLFVMIIFVAFILVGDFGFYSYFQEHLNILAFGLLEDDTNALIETTGKNYPLKTGVVLFSVFALVTFFYLRRVLIKTTPFKLSFIKRSFSYLLFFGLFI
jgi:hypothetical protein